MTLIKICGVTRLSDAVTAAEAGADYIGFNFYSPSPRYVKPEKAREIIMGLPDDVEAVGVFVNENPARIMEICRTAAIGTVQIHGDEPEGFENNLELPVIRALRVSGPSDMEGMERHKPFAFLIDSKSEVYGGSGKKADWDLAAKAKEKAEKLILAGGLSPDNVEEAIKIVKPWAVDTASGVETSPGQKDHEKIRRFIEAVKNVT